MFVNSKRYYLTYIEQYKNGSIGHPTLLYRCIFVNIAGNKGTQLNKQFQNSDLDMSFLLHMPTRNMSFAGVSTLLLVQKRWVQKSSILLYSI
jgi:hypothetical protein